MGLPEEDKGPAWLRDYGRESGYTKSNAMTGYDEGSLAVDLQSLVDFAEALETEHTKDYRPHADEVFKDMSAKVADPHADFIELCSSLGWQRELLVQTSDALLKHDQAVLAFVAAAREISKKYGEADALGAAKAQDVNRNLTVSVPTTAQVPATTQPPTAQTPGTTPSATTIPQVTPTGGTATDTGGDY
ncbi:hypothetical protein Cme02nite_43390 [Catellatospora methionotrophica]|uniref:Uncharacterized protein n=1 Tax=Catellatospora methionotrophica TaxID=121620 RepID=A0A8J3PG83_9ACTN|nr:hypothetical protein [Catellatospora methionotrophica]GIG16007.1 hypothetical protein Cme02nite_43390 [Catellatospora methionotrophica]